MKIGRNEPCPCGSGKKFKKCCSAPSCPQVVEIELSPSELVEARASAFLRNDFGFIYDTFHPDSSFRKQFPVRDEYLEYGRSTLTDDYRIEDCRVLQEKIDGHMDGTGAQVLFYLRVHYQGQLLEYFELSEFQQINDRWYYLQSHKLERQEFDGKLDDITFEDVLKGGICF
ncbi:MAG: SEC-C domain-containing protein [Desulfuromonas sp.]|nr:SEC-C domain-containing protein [Desulfuromonas sp.]